MSALSIIVICLANLNCVFQDTELRIIPIPLIENKGKSQFNGIDYDFTVQYFVVKNYKDCKEADSILYRYADSCKNLFVEKNRQYTAFFYKQTSATSDEAISKKGKHIDRHFEYSDLIYGFRFSTFDNQSTVSKYKDGKAISGHEISIKDVEQ